MSLDALYPFGGDHAIQNATFVLDWKEALSEKDIKGIKTLIQQRLQAFSSVKPIQNLVFNLTPGAMGNVPSAPSTAQAGAVFEIPGSSVSVPARRAIAALRERLQITVNDYGRWAAVFADVEKYFRVVFSELGSQRVASIGLQYSDVFTWRADPKSLNLREVFREGSPYIAPNVFDLQSFWHSHHGFFRRMEDVEGAPECLDNVNINCANNSADVLALTIITSHKIDFPKADWLNGDQIISKMAPIYQSFHGANKRILHSLLTDEVCRRIKLSV